MTDFDLTDPALTAAFEESVDYLNEKCPVARSPDGYWLVSRYDDVKELARNAAEFRSGSGIRPYRDDDHAHQIPVELDAPLHTLWQRALRPFFTPQAVAKYEPGINRAANELLDVIAGDAAADLGEAFTNPFPGVAFFREVLGLPEGDMPNLIATMHLANFGTVEERVQAWVQMRAYADEQLRDRRRQSARDDMLQYVLELDLDGAAVEWSDRVNVVSLLISAGLDTTANVLGGAVWHLASHIDVQAALRSERDLIPRAVEEYLRLFASAFAIGRTPESEHVLHNRRIPAGARVMLGFGTACRDRRAFPDPHQFRLDREFNRHLAFGFGPHHCAGSHLARLELRIALNAVLDRLGEFRLHPRKSAKFAVGMMRSTLSIPVVQGVRNA